jgi:hypothetical protein
MLNIISIIVSTVFLILLISTLIPTLMGGPYVATNDSNIKNTLKLAGDVKGKKMADLGSGDGRLVVAFAKKGVKEAHGFEINPFLVLWSRFLIRRKKLNSVAFIHLTNFWKQDLSKFDIVTDFTVSFLMFKLEKKLKNELKRNARVIVHAFKFPFWKERKKLGAVRLYVVES